jgi:hypothetical protein
VDADEKARFVFVGDVCAFIKCQVAIILSRVDYFYAGNIFFDIAAQSQGYF